MKLKLTSILFLLSFYLFAQNEKDLSEKAQSIFYEVHFEGNIANIKKADSINSILLNAPSVSQEIKATARLENSILKYSKEVDSLLTALKDIEEVFIEKNISQELKDRHHFYKKLYNWKKDPNLEDEVIQHYTNLASQNSSSSLLAEMSHWIAATYFDYRKYKLTIKYNRKSINYLENSNLEASPIFLMQQTGVSYYYTDNIDSTLFFMEDAYRLLTKSKTENEKRMAELSYNLGMLYQGKTGGVEKAAPFLKNTITHLINATSDKNPLLVARYTILSDNYLYQKDLENAALYAEKARVLADEILKEEDVYLRSLVGMSESKIYLTQSNYEAAREKIEKVVEESLGYFGENNRFTIQALIDLAKVEAFDENVEKAEATYIRALEAAKAINRTFSKTAVLNALIDLQFQEKNYEKALKYCLEEENILKTEVSRETIIKATSSCRVAKALIGLGRVEEAKKRLDSLALAVTDVTKQKEFATYFMNVKNEYYLEKYAQTNAINVLQPAKENIDALVEDLISNRAGYNYQDSKVFYSKSILEYIENSVDIYQKLYRENPNSENLNKLLTLIEINKSSALLDGLLENSLQEKENIPINISQLENETRNSINKINEELLMAVEDTLTKENKKVLLDTKVSLNKKLDSIQEVYKKDFSNYYQAKTLQTPEPLKYYQEKYCTAENVIIEYYVSDKNIYRLVITKNDVQFEKIDNVTSIKALSQELRNVLVSRKPFAEISQSLSQKILPELDSSIKQIIFITDGVLSKLPFEILMKDQQLLIHKYAVSYAGSLQLYDTQVQVAKNSKMNWLGYAPEYKDASLSSNTQEVNEISKIINGNSVVGTNATKKSFINQSKDYSVVHLATHGKLSNVNPMLNSLVFYGEDTESSELSASEIYGLDLNANMAVLSACDTGSGKIEAGEGVMSMSRAFTYAGVSSTVVSLWKVPDQQTSKIMVSFYENLEKGQPKNEALRNAKLSFIASTDDDNLKHPYYWAGFVLTGDTGNINTESNLLWYVLGGGILLIGFFFYYKSRKNAV